MTPSNLGTPRLSVQSRLEILVLWLFIKEKEFIAVSEEDKSEAKPWPYKTMEWHRRRRRIKSKLKFWRDDVIGNCAWCCTSKLILARNDECSFEFCKSLNPATRCFFCWLIKTDKIAQNEYYDSESSNCYSDYLMLQS